MIFRSLGTISLLPALIEGLEIEERNASLIGPVAQVVMK